MFDHDIRKQPFNERLVEMIRGKRENVFSIMYDEPQQIPQNPICVQYNFKQKPKTSFGIAFHNINTKKWFVVEPAMTIEMRLILQGYYNVNLLPFLIEQLYESELRAIASYNGNFPEFYKQITGSYPRDTLSEEFWKRSHKLIDEMVKRMLAYRDHSGFVESQFIFPKGRPDDSEAYFLTATREVEEETGIKVLFENPDLSIRKLSRHNVYNVSAPLTFNETKVNPVIASLPEPDTLSTSYASVVVNPPKPIESEFNGDGSHETTTDPDSEMPHGDDEEPNNFIPEPVTAKQNYWEHCRISIPGSTSLKDAYLCKEYVSHSHSDMTGKMYKTTLWICVFEGEDSKDILMTGRQETRMGRWISEEVLRSRFRVQELYIKCEATLNKYFPYLSL